MSDSRLRLRKTMEEELQGSSYPCHLEVVGLHGRLFDDDHLAAFINSHDALLPWNGDKTLLIDRYDVRHLLEDLSGIRKRRAQPPLVDVTQEELDYERYRDLEGLQDAKTTSQDILKPTTEYYCTVQFSYSAKNEDSNIVDSRSGIVDFIPPFPVPNSSNFKLPPSEKVHQIIARTAKFVSEHGGQSEIILRVKQGGNPMFSFLNPDDHLHEYFRYFVQHPELCGTVETTRIRPTESLKFTSEGLSLLGTTYGSDDDKDDDSEEIAQSASPVKDESLSKSLSKCNEAESVVSNCAQETDCIRPKIEPVVPTEESSKNISVPTPCMTVDYESVASKEDNNKENPQLVPTEANGMQKHGAAVNVFALPTKAIILDPPLQLKCVIDKTAEFVAHSGKEFESVVKERIKTDRRFWFLLPWNEYHPYYLQSLQAAQKINKAVHASDAFDIDSLLKPSDEKELKLSSSACIPRAEVSQTLSIENISNGLIGNNDIVPENSLLSSDKKKMKVALNSKDESQHAGFRKKLSESAAAHSTVITGQLHNATGSKTDGDMNGLIDSKEQVTKEYGMSVDAAAAVVMAATRGARRQQQDFSESKATSVTSLHERLSKTAGSSLGMGSDGLSTSDGCVEAVDSSKKQCSLSGSGHDDIIFAPAIARAAALATAREADSADAGLTPAEKLKAERLRRAKMFTAMIKSGKCYSVNGIGVGGALLGVVDHSRVVEISEAAVSNTCRDMGKEQKDAELIVSSKYDNETDAKHEIRSKRHSRTDNYDEPRRKRSYYDDRFKDDCYHKLNKSSWDFDKSVKEHRNKRSHHDHKTADYDRDYHDKYSDKDHDKKDKSYRKKEKYHGDLKEYHGKPHHSDFEKKLYEEKQAQCLEKRQKQSKIRDVDCFQSHKTDKNLEGAMLTEVTNHESNEKKIQAESKMHKCREPRDGKLSQEASITSGYVVAAAAELPGSADTSLTADDIPDDIRAKVRRMLLSNLK